MRVGLPLLAPLLTRYVLRTDGGSRGRVGGAGAVLVEQWGEGEREVWRGSFWLGEGVCALEAEYRALLEGLIAVRSLAPRMPPCALPLRVECDSLAVVRNVRAPSDARPSQLGRLTRLAQARLRALAPCALLHIPRALNGDADRLAAAAMASRGSRAELLDRSLAPDHPARGMLAFRLVADDRLALAGDAYRSLRVSLRVDGLALDVDLAPLWSAAEPALVDLETLSAETFEVTVEDALREGWSRSQSHPLPPSSPGQLWQRVEVCVGGHVRPLRIDVCALALTDAGLPAIHCAQLIRDPSHLYRALLLFALRTERLEWLFGARCDGARLFERVLAEGGARSCRLTLALAQLSCFAEACPAEFVREYASSQGRALSRAQAVLLLPWVSGHTRLGEQ